MTERSVLRLSGERADKKVAHWQSVAIAACEQCGGNRVPWVCRVITMNQWLHSLLDASDDAHYDCADISAPAKSSRLLLSLREGSASLRTLAGGIGAVILLSGPEGGFSPSEEGTALNAGFIAVSLGARVLRSETAAITALAVLA
jgi:16S rRNA (uracil1498-N3)-methyltransferase